MTQSNVAARLLLSRECQVIQNSINKRAKARNTARWRHDVWGRTDQCFQCATVAARNIFNVPLPPVEEQLRHMVAKQICMCCVSRVFAVHVSNQMQCPDTATMSKAALSQIKHNAFLRLAVVSTRNSRGILPADKQRGWATYGRGSFQKVLIATLFITVRPTPFENHLPHR